MPAQPARRTTINDVEHKWCSYCKNYHTLDNFAIDKGTTDGLYRWCKTAVNTRQKERRDAKKSPDQPKLNIKEHQFIDGVEHKHCFACDIFHPLEDFSIANGLRDGLTHLCRSAVLEYGRNRRQAKRDGKEPRRCPRKRREHREIDGVDHITCSYCNEWRATTMFNKSKNNWDGITSKCSKCRLTEKFKQTKAVKRLRNNAYTKRRRATDPNYRIAEYCRKRIREIVKGVAPKAAKSMELVGCSKQQLREHIESQFKEGMSWENHGHSTWHIDHQIPCAAFDHTNPDHQRACFHYSNLQPMWAKENIKKSNKVPEGFDVDAYVAEFLTRYPTNNGETSQQSTQ